jgi:RecJ-like exonuclease
MIIDTKHNVKDKVWGVKSYWTDREIPCEACHGKGGANIPGTGVFVKCQECRGNGKVLQEVHKYWADEHEIWSITARIDREGVRITYSYHEYLDNDDFLGVADSEDEAWVLAKKIADDDEAGELRERRP